MSKSGPGFFDRLLVDHLQPGATSISERAASFNVGKTQGNAVLVFNVDSEAGRKAIGLSKDSKACDGLVAVLSQDRQVLLFVELKGSDVKHAMEQLKATIGAVKETMHSQTWNQFKKIALIVRSGRSDRAPQSSQKKKKAQKDLIMYHGVPCLTEKSGDANLDKLIQLAGV